MALHRYQHRDWSSLIAIWVGLNRQLLAAAEAVPDAAWSRTCTIADSAPLTLQFVFDDYVDHMLHHLRHMGVEMGPTWCQQLPVRLRSEAGLLPEDVPYFAAPTAFTLLLRRDL